MNAGAEGSFLAARARASVARVELARARDSAGSLAARAVAAPSAPPLVLSKDGFDLIAELKLRSPAHGILRGSDDDLEPRVSAYARAGAAIVSVLTEPERFGGTLEHLARASAVLTPLGVPAMRKDFLVDPYQVLEARVAGAGGVLLIVRMLEKARLADLLAAAGELGLFVLLEAFDATDIALAAELAAQWRRAPEHCLIGINSRDLETLEVVPGRLEELAASLPERHPRVAESGLATADDARRLAARGFSLALVGSALMSHADPESLARGMIAAGRRAAGAR